MAEPIRLAGDSEQPDDDDALIAEAEQAIEDAAKELESARDAEARFRHEQARNEKLVAVVRKLVDRLGKRS